MDPNAILMWGGVIAQLAGLGVKSWASVHAVMQDAGLDDAQIELLKSKWDALRDDVARAAGVTPTTPPA